MTNTFTLSSTSTFTRTHAAYLASKVAADLLQMQLFYGRPFDNEINQYLEEAIISRSRNALTSPNKRGLQHSLDRFFRGSRLGFPSESGYEAQVAKCSNWQMS